MKLVAPHTAELIQQLSIHPEIMAIKGCGALGADIILLISKIKDQEGIKLNLEQKQLDILANQEQLFLSRPL